MTKNFKRGAVLAASTAAVVSLVAVSPSFASAGSTSRVSTSSTSIAEVENREAPVAHTHASVPVTITGIPTTVNKVGQIVRGAKFVAYKLAADATALPAAQPTTGGKPSKVEAIVAADNTISYVLEVDAPQTAGAVKYAVYNAAGVGALVTATTDASGVATATSSAALTTVYAEPTKPALGVGKSVKGDRGHKHGERMKMDRG